MIRFHPSFLPGSLARSSVAQGCHSQRDKRGSPSRKLEHIAFCGRQIQFQSIFGVFKNKNKKKTAYERRTDGKGFLGNFVQPSLGIGCLSRARRNKIIPRISSLLSGKACLTGRTKPMRHSHGTHTAPPPVGVDFHRLPAVPDCVPSASTRSATGRKKSGAWFRTQAEAPIHRGIDTGLFSPASPARPHKAALAAVSPRL